MSGNSTQTPVPTHNQPLPWVSRWLSLLQPSARVLDFAAGTGRHARHAASLNLSVTAADRNAEALAAIGEGIHLVCTDLEADRWPFEPAGFDAVIVTNFLDRSRLDGLAGLLAPAGWLIYQTFAAGNARFGRPSNPDFLLQPGELLAMAGRTGLQVAGYEYGLDGQPPNAVVQRIAARRPAGNEPDPAPPPLA